MNNGEKWSRKNINEIPQCAVSFESTDLLHKFEDFCPELQIK